MCGPSRCDAQEEQRCREAGRATKERVQAEALFARSGAATLSRRPWLNRSLR